jgi:hypothetical protein
MPQFFTKPIICILLALLIFSNQSNAMQHSIGVETNRSRLVQWLIDHKIAIATCSAACAFGAYVAYNYEPKKKKLIKVLTSNPVIHLQCSKKHLQNIDHKRSFTNQTVHTYQSASVDEIDITSFIQKGRIYLVENKKQKELAIAMIKIAHSQEDLDTLETAVIHKENTVSVYSKYKDGSDEVEGMVDCVIEYSNYVELHISASQIHKQE